MLNTIQMIVNTILREIEGVQGGSFIYHRSGVW
jgi:hypothetical protein